MGFGWHRVVLFLLTSVCELSSAHVAVLHNSVQSRTSGAALLARGRRLAQQQQIDEDLVRATMPPEPVDWQTYQAEVRNPYQLREALCQAQGNVYLQDPDTGEDVDTCDEVGIPPKRLLLYIREDIFLRGDALPPVSGYLKIEGRCEDNPGQMCSIHAVSALCSDCALPSEDASSNEQQICSACQFGGSSGRDTTPFVLQPGAKLWMRNIELAGCRTTGSGGCINMRSGERNVWSASAQAQSTEALTYLEAENCRFTRGYAAGEGGQVMVQSGSLAVFRDSTFANNYASASGQNTEAQTADKSHDVMVTNYAAVLLERCLPTKLYVRRTEVLESGASFLQAYQQAAAINIPISISQSNEPPARPGENMVTPPPQNGNPDGGGTGSGADESDEASNGISLWLLIVIILVSLFGGAVLVGGCWWCCWASPDWEEDEVSVMKDGKSFFDQVQSTRGMAGKSMMRMRTRMRSGMTNFTSRFQSAFKSTFYKDTGEEGSGRRSSRFAIPGTNKTYSMETLMKGRLRQSQQAYVKEQPVTAWN